MTPSLQVEIHILQKNIGLQNIKKGSKYHIVCYFASACQELALDKIISRYPQNIEKKKMKARNLKNSTFNRTLQLYVKVSAFDSMNFKKYFEE